MKSSKRDIVMNAGFGVAMAILIVISYLYYLNVRAMTEFDQMVEHSQAEILKLEGLLSAMKDVENGEHIFTITGDERSLEPYRAAIGQIDRHLATLKTLTKNHPSQQNRVYRVEPLIRERLAEVAKTIDVRKREGFQAASQREFTGRHKLLTDEIRGQLDEAQGLVMQHLDRRKALKEASTRSMVLAVFAGSSLSFVLLLTIYVLLKRDITKRKRAEEKFRGLLESAPEAVVIVNDKGDICLVNSQTENLFGYDREELYGREVEMLVPERFCDMHANHRVDYFLNPQVRRIGTGTGVYGLRKDGREFPADISLSPLSTDEGVLVIATIRDISEPRLMEETLRFSEDRYRALFRDNPTMIVTLDADLKLLTVNPICASQLGYTIGELEGRPVLELFFADDRPAVAEQLRMSLRNPGQVYRWQFRKIHKDGKLLWVEETAQAIYDLKGSLNLLVVCQDITERKRAEEERDWVYKYSLDLLCVAGFDGYFKRVSPSFEKILGWSEAELLSRSIFEIIHPDDLEATCQEFKTLEGGKQAIDFENRYRCKNGSYKWLSWNSHPMIENKLIIGVARDITERKRVEKDIERLNADLATRAADLEAVNLELEAFNYTVAHDLRNPLNVISSYCQVFKELCGDKLDEQCMHYIHETYNGTLRMNRLIEALLNFSRLAHAELNREKVDLSSMARDVAAELKGTEAGRRVDFRIADGMVADGDANLLRVVLANLLGNAWKYTGTREEALIEFSTQEIDGKPVYYVRDNGSGFDNAAAEKIFAPFQRLPSAEECRGFGIGLATVEKIIRRHGGRVCAEGEPGKGATFYFTLSADRVSS